MSNRLKVGIIGSGQVARATHLPIYKKMPEVEVVAVCDTKLEAAKKLASDFGIKHAYADYHQMLEQLHPDAVNICVPNKFHSSIAIDALQAGCHVFCEKPPALTKEEAQSMAMCAYQNGKILTYDFHLRHTQNVKLVKKKIDAGILGNLYHAQAYWIRRLGIPGWGNFINKDMQGGGALIDIGAHVLDICLYLLGYPKISYVAASASNRIGISEHSGLMGSWSPEKFTVEDGLFGFIKFTNGVSLEIAATFALHTKERDSRNVLIFGDKAGASIFPVELYSGSGQNLTNEVFPFLDDKDSHIDAIHNFVMACMGKEKILVTAEQGVYVQNVISSLYASANSGKPILL